MFYVRFTELISGRYNDQRAKNIGGLDYNENGEPYINLGGLGFPYATAEQAEVAFMNNKKELSKLLWKPLDTFGVEIVEVITSRVIQDVINN